MIQKLLPGAREARLVVAAHQAGERFLPAQSQPFELLQELTVENRRGIHDAIDGYAAAWVVTS